MTTFQIIAVAIFVITMVLVVSEVIHRTVAAMLGAVAILLIGVLSFDMSLHHIDFNTLGVLLGMMLFVGCIKESGLFEYLAVKSARIVKGDPWLVLVALVLVTAVLSAFLDNVTTVLLIGPMTITICRMLDVDPIPYFMTQILASNIGGTATLIGDPPNIMIGSATGYAFFDFIKYDAPCVVIILAVVIVLFRFMYGRKLVVSEEARQNIMALDEKDFIKDKRLFVLSVVMIFVVALGFMLHGALNVESSVVALTAAAIMLLLSGQDIEHTVHSVEWTTIGFFAGLFIIVGALAETGVIGIVAEWLVSVTAGNMTLAMIVILWASAIISSIVDNIPFVATMIPVITTMASTGLDVTPLWWAVSLGACLGGCGTLIGASANVVLASIATKAGYRITFMSYLKAGFPIMIVTVLISMVYLLVIF